MKVLSAERLISLAAAWPKRPTLFLAIAAAVLVGCTSPAPRPRPDGPARAISLDGQVLILDDGVKPEVVHGVKARIEEATGLRVEVRQSAVDLSPALAAVREQHDMGRMLRLVARHLDGANGRVLLLTPKDTFGDGLDWSTGRSLIGGPVALVSTHRLDPEFWGDGPNVALEVRRAGKIALHELGHTFGRAEHCPRWECCVHGAGDIDEIDRIGDDYCPDCRALAEAARRAWGPWDACLPPEASYRAGRP